jgi:cyclase
MVDGAPVVFSNFGQTNTNISLFDWISTCEELGAGEIFMNAIDRDGMGNGFDIPTIGAAVDATRLPVVACGGAGDLYDFVDLARDTRVSGIAAGNWFHFVERSYPRAKQLMKKNKINVR